MRFSIRYKIMVLVAVIIFAASAVFTVKALWTERNAIYEGLDHHLKTAALAVPLILGEEYHDLATEPGAIDPEAYFEYKRRLSDYANAMDIVYVYTIVRREGRFHFTSSSSTEEEWLIDDHEAFFELYDPAPEILDRVFDTGETWFEEYTDRYGTFRSVFIPRTSPEGRDYVVGVDIPIDFIEARLRSGVNRGALIGLSILLVSLLVSYFLLKKQTEPLKSLTARIEAMAGNDFAPLDPESRKQLEQLARATNDEVGDLAKAFIGMERTLQEHIRNLERETAQRERMESELTIAREIQMGLLPKIFPPFRGSPDLDLAAYLEPARAVGGDLYDFFFIDDDTFFFAVGDVSDKGIPAALFMAVTKSLLKTIAVDERDPDGILRRLNDILCEENERGLFVTFFCAVVDLRDGTMTFSDGGHNRPLLKRAGQPAEWLPKPDGGIALGVVPDVEYSSRSVRLQPGDTVYFYTDGVTEAYNPLKELYGDPRLLSLVDVIDPGLSAADKVQQVLDDVKSFTLDAEPSDDLTLLCFQLKAKAISPPEPMQVTLASDPAELPRLTDILNEWAGRQNLPENTAGVFNVCLDEIVTNVIKHGYEANGMEGPIVLELLHHDEWASVTVIDEAPAFDPLAHAEPDTTLSVEDRPIGGLGIHLVRKMMDDVTYEFRDGANRLTIRKRVPDGK